MDVSTTLVSGAYLIAGLFFILALSGLSKHETARMGNRYGIAGMVIALVVTVLLAGDRTDWNGLFWIVPAMVVAAVLGMYVARKVEMTQMPELIAILHSFVGLAAVLVGWNSSYEEHAAIAYPTIHDVEVFVGVFIGAVTFTGSIVAYLKLSAKIKSAPKMLPAHNLVNLGIIAVFVVLTIVYCLVDPENMFLRQLLLGIMTLLALFLGWHLVSSIGGGDMPVVVSMLNSYSGWAAAAAGFLLNNALLIITGALVGSSGAFLSYIMCKGMNRSFVSVILGGFGADAAAAGPGGKVETRPVKQGSADDAAFIMKNASKVIIVPGYGMAVSQAQHALREMADKLKEEGVEVKYAIHPVAGRMPGHMNVLLAEANVPYDEVFELEDINSEFSTADVAFVIGANDVTNPAAKTDPTSAIFGMPILDVEKARTVLFVKRGMASGYAGVENELFFRDNTMMLFGDAKKMVEGILKGL